MNKQTEIELTLNILYFGMFGPSRSHMYIYIYIYLACSQVTQRKVDSHLSCQLFALLLLLSMEAASTHESVVSRKCFGPRVSPSQEWTSTVVVYCPVCEHLFRSTLLGLHVTLNCGCLSMPDCVYKLSNRLV